MTLHNILKKGSEMASRFLLSALMLLGSTSLAHAQSASAPIYSVGDTWTRQDRDGKFTLSVVKLENGGMWMSGRLRKCRDCLVFISEGRILKVTHPDGSDVDVTRSEFVPQGPDWKFYYFPLEVNKPWTLDARGYSPVSISAQFHIDFRVVAYEDVKTLAGVFKAYRIQRSWLYKWPGSVESLVRWNDTVWWAPEVRSEVKFEASRPEIKNWELSSFSVK